MAEALEPLVLPPFRPIATLSLDTNAIHQYAGESTTTKLGTIRGVVVPTCEFMWSVLLFVRFGQTVGTAGLLLTIVVILLCATTMTITMASISSIATNGIPRGGVYRILEKSLGSGVGGSIAILYLAGIILLISVEIVGSVQGLVQWMQHEPLITGSPYFDQLLFSAVSLLIVLLIALMPKSVSSRVAVVFLIVLVFAFASMLLGLAVSGETGADPIIQPSLETLQSNLLPAGELLNFSDTLSIMLPCFIGLYSGVSNAHHLRWPAKSIPLGGFSSIGLSASLYCCLCSLFALCVPRELLQHDIMIGVRSAVPWPGLVIAGVYIVGLGASLQCALTASAVLASLMDRQLLAPCRPLDGQSPHRPILLVVLFASPMVLLTDLEFLAKLTALCFCLNYGSTNIACSLLSAFKSPVWRPQFQISWQWSLIGALLCLFCMLAINTYAAFLSVLAASFLAYAILTSTSNLAWGHGLHGLLFHITLKYLIAAEQVHFRSQINRLLTPPTPSTAELTPALLQHLPSPPYADKMWRPQMLVFVKTHRNGLPKYPHFLSFVSQLKTFSVLCIFSNIITNKEMSQLILQYQRRHLGAAIDEESAIGDGDRIELEQTILTERKLLLQQEMRRHSIEGFVKVFTAPNSQIGQHILLHTMGLGELTPNTVIMEWPDSIPPSREIIDELQTVWQLTKRLGLSCLLCRGLSDFPDNHSVMIGNIDVWWLVEGGHLLLLIAYILQRHRVWNSCQIRLFAVCCTADDTTQIHEELEMLISLLRINVEWIQVITLESMEIKARTYGQSLRFNDEVISRCITGELRGEYKRQTTKEPYINTSEESETVSSDFTSAIVIPQLIDAILTNSEHSSLVVLNLPVPSAVTNFAQTSIYMKLIDCLTDRLRRVVIYQVGEQVSFDETIASD